MPKPSILIFIEHYLPGYKFGGPIQSVANLVTLLKPHYNIHLVTRDRDEGDTNAYDQLKIDEWLFLDGYHVRYLPPQRLTLSTVKSLITEQHYDFLYTNSLFSHFTRLLLLACVFSGRQLTIAPRGELHEGAIRLKAYKKRPYVALLRMLPKKLIVWHATDQQEVTAIEQAFSRPKVSLVPIRFAPDIPASQPERGKWRKDPGQLRLVSIARIARNKGLKFLLECLSSLTSGQVTLDIYGPVVDIRYWEECQQLIAAMPAMCQINYHGELNHAQVSTTMQRYDFLAMPTHGENFGHVIFEAFSSGLPVLISDQTPWKNLADSQAGWDLPLHQATWVDVLNTCVSLNQEAHNLLVMSAAQKAKNYLDNEPFEANYLNLFSR